MPNSELLEKRRRGRNDFGTGKPHFLDAVNDSLHLATFQFAYSDQAFLRLEGTLVENRDVADFTFQLRCQFGVKLRLGFPDGFKFIQIVLTIENFVSQAMVGILLQFFHLILANGQMPEVELLASVANLSKVSASSHLLSIDILKDYRQFFQSYLFGNRLDSPFVLFLFGFETFLAALHSDNAKRRLADGPRGGLVPVL